MSYQDYETVKDLPIEDQRWLLHRGDEVERVWAAWSLALELGSRIVPEFRDRLDRCPFPGTRRHLIVVLAGFGERSILERYFRNDPDEEVRSTSARYLIRTSAGPINPHLLDRMRSDPSPVVRTTVLQEMGDLRATINPEPRNVR